MNCNSFSIFGKDNKYSAFLPLLVRMHHSLYPCEWEMVIHTDNISNKLDYMNVLIDMQKHNLVSIVDCSSEMIFDSHARCISMLWRILPIWNNRYDCVFCRDLDSLLTPRMTKYVLSFVNSGKTIHGINDNNSHNIPLMGGLIGFRSEKFLRNIGNIPFKSLIERSGLSKDQWNTHGCDQEFLMKNVWPLVKDDALIHSIKGPNERFMLRDCCNDIDISWMGEYLIEHGDELTNYMGAACNINSPFNGSLYDNIKYAINIFDKYGNNEKMKTIIEIEKKKRME